MNTGLPQLSPALINELPVTIIGRDIAASLVQTWCNQISDAKIHFSWKYSAVHAIVLCIYAYKYIHVQTTSGSWMISVLNNVLLLPGNQMQLFLNLQQNSASAVYTFWSLVSKDTFWVISGVWECVCVFFTFRIFVCWHTDNGKGQSLHSD